MGPGRGPVYGTKVHSEFANRLTALDRPDVHPEVSYLNGQIVPYSTRGSVRMDVVIGTPEQPTAVFDLKTGSSSLLPGRIEEFREHLPPSSSSIPITEVRPDEH